MKQPRFTDQQIAFALKQAEAGTPIFLPISGCRELLDRELLQKE